MGSMWYSEAYSNWLPLLLTSKWLKCQPWSTAGYFTKKNIHALNVHDETQLTECSDQALVPLRLPSFGLKPIHPHYTVSILVTFIMVTSENSHDDYESWLCNIVAQIVQQSRGRKMNWGSIKEVPHLLISCSSSLALYSKTKISMVLRLLSCLYCKGDLSHVA